MSIRGVSLVVLFTVLMGGCAATGPSAFDVPAGSYGEAFAAARDELRAMGFELDRVDARHGVITTRSRPTAGMATPWMDGESTPYQSLDGTLNRQARRVSIRFEPSDGALGRAEVTGEALPADLRLYPGPLHARVEATIQRAQRPGLRAPAASVRLASPTIDPNLADRGLYPAHTVDLGQDNRLAARVVAAITRWIPHAGE